MSKPSQLHIVSIVAALIIGGIAGYWISNATRHDQSSGSKTAGKPARANSKTDPSLPAAKQPSKRVPIEVEASAFNNISDKMLAFYKDAETSKTFRMRDIRGNNEKNQLFFRHQKDLTSEQKRELLELMADKQYGGLQAATFMFTDPIQMGAISDAYDKKFKERVVALLGQETAARYFDYAADNAPWKILDRLTNNVDFDCPPLSAAQQNALVELFKGKTTKDILTVESNIIALLTPDQLPYYEYFMEEERAMRQALALDKKMASEYFQDRGVVPESRKSKKNKGSAPE